MTPAEFKLAKPQFAAVPDATVQAYLDTAARFVDDSWGDDADAALTAMTCHLMTMDGLGTDAQSQANASGASEYQTVRSGLLTLTRFQKAASTSTFKDWLMQTNCGQFYAILLRMNRGGPRVVRGGPSVCLSPYAKDGWPLWVDNGYP